ncbi:FAD:protein FMN transferase [Desemzia sp. RIT804]|uniref:FAD:protein FMN transferase n=1 Tax=Desemzia sp. RIT 804 TaxID=2810209 RepID=UPI001951033D|nr:FAD:protein FMN transferase [Desemzia sp. RIT 804]MBM6615863.1 FAD:protein FMN transferase [Desemzia sp. RIT 804]
MEQKSKTLHLMGTVIDLLIEHESADALLTEVSNRLKEYEHRFSANDPSSELMAINRNAGIQPVFVQSELYHLIKIGKFHSCAPDSHLNIAIGPLVQSWRIGFKDAKVPSGIEIDMLLEKTDPQNIILNDEEQTVYLTEKGMLIDLGCLAKGYIADLVNDYLKRMGVASGLINLGGNIVGLGPSPDHEKNYWKIGIQNPNLARKNYLTALKIANQSVVTSGVYERSLVSEGKTYHHILDPHTGYPTKTDVASLTIRSELSLEGEIWTTRLYGKSSDEVIKELNQLEGIDGLVVTKDGKIVYSNGLEEIMV